MHRTLIASLGFFAFCYCFFHASAAACLIKEAHNSQNRRCGNDYPFSPYSWPPEYSQNNNGYSQQKPAETKLHDFPPLLRLVIFFL